MPIPRLRSLARGDRAAVRRALSRREIGMETQAFAGLGSGCRTRWDELDGDNYEILDRSRLGCRQTGGPTSQLRGTSRCGTADQLERESREHDDEINIRRPDTRKIPENLIAGAEPGRSSYLTLCWRGMDFELSVPRRVANCLEASSEMGCRLKFGAPVSSEQLPPWQTDRFLGGHSMRHCCTDKSGRVTTAAVRADRGTESSNPFPSRREFHCELAHDVELAVEIFDPALTLGGRRGGSTAPSPIMSPG